MWLRWAFPQRPCCCLWVPSEQAWRCLPMSSWTGCTPEHRLAFQPFQTFQRSKRKKTFASTMSVFNKKILCRKGKGQYDSELTAHARCLRISWLKHGWFSCNPATTIGDRFAWLSRLLLFSLCHCRISTFFCRTTAFALIFAWNYLLLKCHGQILLFSINERLTAVFIVFLFFSFWSYAPAQLIPISCKEQEVTV